MRKMNWNITVALLATLAAGTLVFADESVEQKNIGIRYTLTDEMKDAGLTVRTYGMSNMNPEGELDLYCGDIPLASIIILEKDYAKQILDSNSEAKSFDELAHIAYPEFDTWAEEGDTCEYLYVDVSTNQELLQYEEAEAKAAEESIPYIREFFDKIEYIPLEKEEIGKNALTFEVKNLDGEQVTEQILGEKDYTIINVWATYCNPCINEMPELAAWEKELPENVQILYLCSDIRSEDSKQMELANQIVDKSGINRKNVVYDPENTFSEITDFVTGVPTTFFIDREGKVAEGYEVVGAYMAKYKENLKELLG